MFLRSPLSYPLEIIHLLISLLLITLYMTNMGRNPSWGVAIQFLTISNIIYPWYFAFTYQLSSPPYWDRTILVFNILMSMVYALLQLGWGGIISEPLWRKWGFPPDKVSQGIAESYSKDKVFDELSSMTKWGLQRGLITQFVRDFYLIEQKAKKELGREDENGKDMSPRNMGFKNNESRLKKIGILFGLIEIYAVGMINAVHSDVRWPTSSGVQFLIDVFYVSYSNPYALLSGVLVYLFFYRLAEISNEMRKGKTDLIFIIIAVVLMILVSLLIQGIIVY